MKLNENHRRVLLDELEIATAQYKEYILLKEDAPSLSEGYCEIRIFLETERIELIKKSLITNEIDY